MDMIVLERLRASLQHVYQQQNDQANLHFAINFDHRQNLLPHNWHPDHQFLPYTEMDSPSSFQPDHQRSYSAVSNSINSSITRAIMSKHDHLQCDSSLANVSSSVKKRKAEFDIEEEVKDKVLKAQETDESEVTVKPETSTKTCSKSSTKISEVQKPDYIHVRARRGQATDSHSLAERARREKISKKMKCLQDLVPGCSKVTGKAGMLDEIINYVQSLQKQVEFLSLKLATLNPSLDINVDNFFMKEIPAYIAQLETANPTCFQYNQIQQGTSHFESDITMDQTQMLAVQKAGSSSMQISEAFLPQLQQLPGWDPDWTILFNGGFN